MPFFPSFFCVLGESPIGKEKCEIFVKNFNLFHPYSVGAIKNIRIKVVNQAFADLFNMRPERWTNRSIMPLLKAPDQPLWAYIHKMANEKENVTFRIKSQFLQEEMLISMKMTSPYYGTLVMMPLGQK